MQPARCLNCEQTILPEQKFCSQCGQKTDIHRLDFHYLVHEAVHSITHADKSIFNLLAKLSYQPGHVARNFLAGKRKRFLSPLNFYLIIIGVFVFLLSTFKTFEQPTNFAAWRAGISQIKDPIERDRKLQKIDRSENAMKFMSKNSNLVNLLAATPLVSLIFFVFYRKRAYNFTEHLVSNFYFSGFAASVFMLLIAPVINIFQSTNVYLTGIACFLLFELLYRSIAYYQLMNIKGTRHYLYALFASFTAVICWILLSRWVINTYIETGFKSFF